MLNVRDIDFNRIRNYPIDTSDTTNRNVNYPIDTSDTTNRNVNYPIGHVGTIWRTVTYSDKASSSDRIVTYYPCGGWSIN